MVCKMTCPLFYPNLKRAVQFSLLTRSGCQHKYAAIVAHTGTERFWESRGRDTRHVMGPLAWVAAGQVFAHKNTSPTFFSTMYESSD